MTSTTLYEHPNPNWLETNRYAIGPWLGRVNRLALLPSALMVGALAWTTWRVLMGSAHVAWSGRQHAIMGLLLLAIATSLGRYAWFLIRYPNLGKGDTIKASYVLQIFPMLSIRVGYGLWALQRRSKMVYWTLLVVLALIAVHNMPAMITQYPFHPTLSR